MESCLFKISRIGIPLLLVGTLFLSLDFFIDKEINPKIYAFVILSYILGICLLFLYRGKFMISSWGITVVLLILYINVDSMFTASCRLTTLCLWGFGVLLLFFTHVPIPKNTDKIIVVLCVLQSVYGLLQYWNLTRNTTIYPVTGRFCNPGGFPAVLSTAFPLIFLLLQNNKLYKLSGIRIGSCYRNCHCRFWIEGWNYLSCDFTFYICLYSFIFQNRKIEMVIISLFIHSRSGFAHSSLHIKKRFGNRSDFDLASHDRYDWRINRYWAGEMDTFTRITCNIRPIFLSEIHVVDMVYWQTMSTIHSMNIFIYG